MICTDRAGQYLLGMCCWGTVAGCCVQQLFAIQDSEAWMLCW